MDYNEWNNEQIRKVRTALGLTLKEFAALIGMSAVNLYYVEQGKHKLQSEYIEILEDKLGITPRRAKRLVRQFEMEQVAETHGELAIAKLDKVKLGKR
ncbi:helix-turn-helix domain-containing protein [Alkalibacillus almallahensis]|uniref:helix-turn-helix domain-containing protein n=1 Tax=Alkalibacillus almallahensis TaxID=1379154 RepID=UPI001421572D|nr:helix-turn-helix transcriptional regulator [Alkalibacillus almallahensis]NIK13142.1 transcriptional regulator with XRE-family HTH domain [Alkalibacillus almallahensis]